MKNLLNLLIAFALLHLFCTNVYAHNCGGEFQPETGICRIIGSDGKQILYNSDPPQSSNNASPRKKIIEHKIVYLPSKYGAIASDKKTATIGSSMNMNSEAAAKKAAIQSCQNGNRKLSCKIVALYGNGCIAAVGGSQGTKGLLFKAVDENPGGYAVKKAMAKCQQSGASECQVLIEEQCSR